MVGLIEIKATQPSCGLGLAELGNRKCIPGLGNSFARKHSFLEECNGVIFLDSFLEQNRRECHGT